MLRHTRLLKLMLFPALRHMLNQGLDDENDVLHFLILVRLFFILHVLLLESEHCR